MSNLLLETKPPAASALALKRPAAAKKKPAAKKSKKDDDAADDDDEDDDKDNEEEEEEEAANEHEEEEEDQPAKEPLSKYRIEFYRKDNLCSVRRAGNKGGQVFSFGGKSSKKSEADLRTIAKEVIKKMDGGLLSETDAKESARKLAHASD